MYIYNMKSVKMHITGIVTSDNTVDKNTHLTANPESQPYFSARIAVVVPAGIAVSITATDVASGARPRSLHENNTSDGSKIRRIKL